MIEKETKNNIEIVGEGISAVSNILNLVSPIFTAIPIVVFVVNRIIGFIDDKDIVNRLKKIEKKLDSRKISLDEFKNKIINMTEHKRYFSTNCLESIIKNCIPETVDIYISLFIDYVMNDKWDIEEELCEIIENLNKNDLELLKLIKNYLNNGGKKHYDLEVKRKEEIEKYNEEIRAKNAKVTKEEIEKIERDGFIYQPYYENRERSLIIDKDTTIFWNDFSLYYNISQLPLYYLMLKDIKKYYPTNNHNWLFIGKSFLKLERCGILQLDFRNTEGTTSDLNISRFHITLLGKELFKYINN